MRRLVILGTLCAMALAMGCKKPRKFVRTKQQQQRVEDAVLSAAPAPRFKVDANFDDTIKLIGVDIDPKLPQPGGKITVHFYWEVMAELSSDGDWMIFVHVEGPVAGGGPARVIADHYAVEDGPGGAGLYPPKEWKKGQIIKDTKTIDLVDPKGRKLGPGIVKIHAGLFDMEAYRNKQQDVRLKVKTAPEHDGNHRVVAAAFQVGTGGPKPAPPAKPFKAPELDVRKAVGPITIDGKLDEASWKGAVMTAAFGKYDGKPLPAALRTQMKVLWDDEALYVGFFVRDSQPTSSFTKRDETLWEEDVVEVYLDPDSDGKNYVEMQVSPKNVIFDALFTSHREPKPDVASRWNLAGLQTAIHVGPLPGRQPIGGWTVEMRIPYAGLTAAKATVPKVGTKWKANFFRIEKLKKGKELAAWSPPGGDFHNLAKAGFLNFVDMPAAEKARILAPAPTPAPAKTGGTVIPPRPGAAPVPRPAMNPGGLPVKVQAVPRPNPELKAKPAPAPPAQPTGAPAP